MSRLGTLLTLAAAWLFIAGLVALQVWPHLPTSASGWILFIVLVPPLYVTAEGASEYFWRSRAGTALSEPSHQMQRVFVVLSIVLGGAFAWGFWWLTSH